MTASPVSTSSIAFTLTLVVLASFTLIGCFGGDDASEPDPQSLRGAVSQFSQAIGEVMGDDSRRAETVDFRVLQEMLPESIAGMEREAAEGERQSMGGMSVSHASGKYADDEASLELRMLDGGGAGSLMVVGAVWMMASFDRETSTGFERTTRLEGYPAFEKQELRGERVRSELQFVVAERFVVSLEGNGMTVEDLRSAVSALDLAGLEAMRNEGRTES